MEQINTLFERKIPIEKRDQDDADCEQKEDSGMKRKRQKVDDKSNDRKSDKKGWKEKSDSSRNSRKKTGKNRLAELDGTNPKQPKSKDAFYSQIQKTVHKKKIPHVKQPGKRTLIYFDLQTSGLEGTPHITQIGATRGNKSFNCFVMPKKPIEEEAAGLNKMKVADGVLLKRGKPVKAVGIKRAMKRFLAFIRKSSDNYLIGHYIRYFDCPIILRAAKAVGKYDKFVKSIKGCVDTCELFRLTHPGMGCYKQKYLVERLLGPGYESYDAMHHVNALKELIEKEKTDVFAKNLCPARFSLMEAEYKKDMF